MTRVLIDATALDSGHRTRGIGRYVQGLIEGFRAIGDLPAGLELSLLRTKASGEASPYAEVVFRRYMNKDAAKMFVENRLRLNAKVAQGAELFHATAMEGVITGVPWVATCHDLIPLDLRGPYLRPWDLEAQLFWRAYVRRLREGPARVIAISDFVRNRLIAPYGLDPARIDVVRHGVAPFWFEPPTPPAPELVRKVGDRPFVLFVGGFDVRKNFAGLVEALRHTPGAPRVIVAGQRSETIRRRHARLLRGRSADVLFLEYIDDVALRWLYSRAVCLAFPSIAEGWGLPIVEAMASCCPVVCANVGSMAEAAGGAALAIDVHDPRAIAAALGTLLLSPARQAELRGQGLERARKLTWKACAEGTLDVYGRAIGSGRPHRGAATVPP
jgi:glycosyltransferase involved in cell wall biosynthesis